MNNAIQILCARRSVREFTDEGVTDEQVRSLLDAAMAAPSACAKDPWDFVVSRQREMLDRMADVLPNGQMLRHAPLGILVCGDIARAHDRQESYLLQDCSAAIENLLLAASLLGLGACWLGVHPRSERVAGMRALFGLPAQIIPVSAVAVGHPASPAKARTRYRDAYVHMERW